MCAHVRFCVYTCACMHVHMYNTIHVHVYVCVCGGGGGVRVLIIGFSMYVFRLPVKDIRQRMKQVKVEEKLLTHPQQVLVSICTVAK